MVPGRSVAPFAFDQIRPNPLQDITDEPLSEITPNKLALAPANHNSKFATRFGRLSARGVNSFLWMMSFRFIW